MMVCVVSTFLVSCFPNILPIVDPMVEDTPLTILSLDSLTFLVVFSSTSLDVAFKSSS